MKKLAFSLAAVAFAAFGPAHAGKIDFVAAAAGTPQDRGGIANNTPTIIDGVNMSFFATRELNGNVIEASAYLDDLNSAGLPGGLGVCGELGTINGVSNQCQPSKDDNISPFKGNGDPGLNEKITINFLDAPFEIEQLSFNGTINGVEHLSLNSFSGGVLNIITSLGGAETSYLSMTFAAASSFMFGQVDWIRFEAVDTPFYLSAINEVPVPAALPLLISGLAGLGFASRRRKTA
jgi:hypothetical protein